MARIALCVVLMTYVLITTPTVSGQTTIDESVTVIQREWTKAALQKRYKREGARAWRDKDTLTIFRRSGASRVWVVGSIQKPMRRVEGSDCWVLDVEVKQLDEAVIGYGFLEGNATALVDQQVWRGPDAPLAVQQAAQLKGRMEHDRVRFNALNENRKVEVYLPPGHNRRQSYPVVYMADGESTSAYAQMLEPAILSGKLPPTIIVGVHSGGYRGESGKTSQMEWDFRAIEYLLGAEEMIGEKLVHKNHFSAHEQFFTQLVRQRAEKRYGAAKNRDQRILFGCSNGAAFVVAMAQRHPDLYGNVLAFSLAGRQPMVPAWQPQEAPGHYLVAGLLEPAFYRLTKTYADQLAAAGHEAAFRDRVSGHDGLMWREEFVAAVQWALSGERQ